MKDDYEEVKIFGIDINEVYDMNLEEAYNFVKKNSSYLLGISISDVKEIHFSYYKNVFVLLTNGELYKDGEQILDNVETLGFSAGITIIAFTKDKKIINLIGNTYSQEFINNKDYSYKKIIITPLKIVALTYDKTIRFYGMLVDEAIDYSLFNNVDDICYQEHDEDILCIKDDKVYSLFLLKDYTPYNVDKTLMGEGDNFIIL